ncbi:MAG: hypothetical protein OEW87_01020 [Flavobacteriaceae bacterium]|nr:hypothetical protein [Flavobacteriaceae bacterium]
MHKKLEAELVSLAHSILQMKNRHEALALKEKARAIYEKLSVLTYVEDYGNMSPNISSSEEEILAKIEKTIDKETASQDLPNNVISKPTLEEKKKLSPEVTFSDTSDDIFEPKFDSVRIDIESLKSNQISSKEEFRDAISADKTSTLFDDAKNVENEKKSLNDKLLKSTIQIGLNDRIAFVNNLFNFNQAEFNRVLSQLNTFKTQEEAIGFINKQVKPEYDWSDKEDYEIRFIALIERKFS